MTQVRAPSPCWTIWQKWQGDPSQSAKSMLNNLAKSAGWQKSERKVHAECQIWPGLKMAWEWSGRCCKRNMECNGIWLEDADWSVVAILQGFSWGTLWMDVIWVVCWWWRWMMQTGQWRTGMKLCVNDVCHILQVSLTGGTILGERVVFVLGIWAAT